MKNKMKVFGLGVGVFAMSFGFFSINPSFAQEDQDDSGMGEPHHICCPSNSSGCTDLGGGYWPTDESRYAVTCTR
ncbi:hypothetical protein [Algoriphagus sp.]|uniref:hypothetical protein n=1 Tax=Algoriphagus sp. TaxID=1872435 RepID=UPI00262E3CD8|nr:hypothetical protein [Algoriphagus sp.]